MATKVKTLFVATRFPWFFHYRLVANRLDNAHRCLCTITEHRVSLLNSTLINLQEHRSKYFFEIAVEIAKKSGVPQKCQGKETKV